MTNTTFTTGDRVSWFDDDNKVEGVVQERSAKALKLGGDTLEGSGDDAALRILTSDESMVLKSESEVRRVIIPA